MVIFVSQIVLVASLGTAVYMAVRKVPRLVELEESSEKGRGFFSIVKTSAFGLKGKVRNMRRDDFHEEAPVDKGKQVDREGDYWKKIRQG